MIQNNTEDNQNTDQNLNEFDLESFEDEIGAFDPAKINYESDIPSSYAKNAVYENYLAGNLAQQPVYDYTNNEGDGLSPGERQFQQQQELDYKLSNLNQRVRNADPYAGARAGTYNARYNGANFERYYGHKDSGLYQKLGFNPYRNNEELYNQNTSGYKEWQRANDHWWTIFKAGYKNYLAGNLAQQPVYDYTNNEGDGLSPGERQFQQQQELDYKLSNLNQRVRNADPYAGARAGTYNARYNGANFERYYGHKDSGLYQKLGFNPYRNNEELYNQNTSGS